MRVRWRADAGVASVLDVRFVIVGAHPAAAVEAFERTASRPPQLALCGRTSRPSQHGGLAQPRCAVVLQRCGWASGLAIYDCVLDE